MYDESCNVVISTDNNSICNRAGPISSLEIETNDTTNTKEASSSFNRNKWLAKTIKKEIIKSLLVLEKREDIGDYHGVDDEDAASVRDVSLSSSCSCQSLIDLAYEMDQNEPPPSTGTNRCYELPASDMSIEQLQHYVVVQLPFHIQRGVAEENWNRIFGRVSSTKDSAVEESIETASRRVRKLIDFGKKKGMLK